MPEELPPQWMWHLDDPLEDWFAEVDRKREERISGDSSSLSDDNSGTWVENEYAKGRR